MANDYVRRWVSAQAAQRKPVGNAMNPEAALQNNPFYVGPPGSPVPRWITDPLGRNGRTPAWPNPQAVPPDATLNPRATFIPASGIGATEILDQPLPQRYAPGESPESPVVWDRQGQPGPQPYPSPAAGGMEPVGPYQMAPNPGLRLGPLNPLVEQSARQQAEELVRSGAGRPMPMPAYQPREVPFAPASASATPGSASAAPRPKGVTEPGRPPQMTMSQAFNAAQQRLSQRQPFRSRLG